MQDQFTFIHDAILESVTCGDTQISATNLRATIVKLGKKAGFQHQMKVREKMYKCCLVNVRWLQVSPAGPRPQNVAVV